MISFKTLGSALFLAGIAIAGYTGAAEAHKRSYKHSHHSHKPYCLSRVEGRATGQGLFGAGSAQARDFAIADWQDRVANRWGPAYANFSNARGAVFDCKKGAILKAKCVVTAMPCRG